MTLRLKVIILRSGIVLEKVDDLSLTIQTVKLIKYIFKFYYEILLDTADVNEIKPDGLLV